LNITRLALFTGIGLSAAFCCFAGTEDFNEIRSEHFIIRYHPDVKIDYVYRVKNASEDYYRTITQEFRLVRDKLWLWEDRARIYIAGDKNDFLNRFSCPTWSGACVNYEQKLIYTFPYQARFKGLLAHELTHIIFREYVGRDKLPLWLDEAVASYIEDSSGSGHYRGELRSLNRLIRDKKHIPFAQLNQITAEELNTQSPEFISTFYLESFSIIYYLVREHGRDSLARFFFFLKRDYTMDDALAKGFHYSFRNKHELEDKWKRFYLR